MASSTHTTLDVQTRTQSDRAPSKEWGTHAARRSFAGPQRPPRSQAFVAPTLGGGPPQHTRGVGQWARIGSPSSWLIRLTLSTSHVVDTPVGPAGRGVAAPGLAVARADGGDTRSARVNRVRSRHARRPAGFEQSVLRRPSPSPSRARRATPLQRTVPCETPRICTTQTSNSGCTRRRAAGVL